jgi:hypothetical protein
MGGRLGLEIDLRDLPGGVTGRAAGCGADTSGGDSAEINAPGKSSSTADTSRCIAPAGVSRDDFALFSESQGRMVVTVAPGNRDAFEKQMAGRPHALIGTVTAGDGIFIRGVTGEMIVKMSVESALETYRKTFRDF